MPFVSVAGTDLSFEDTAGSGPPVVFLHGFLFDGRQFEAQIDALRDTYRCIALDFPGQGRAGRSTVGYSTEDLTGLVVAFLERLDLGPVHLVGLSMGGFTAIRIGARRPDLVRSLALLNTSAGPHARAKFPRQLALAAVTLVAGTSLPPITAGIEAEMFGTTFLEDPASEPIRSVWRTRWAASDRLALVQTLLGFMLRGDFRAHLAEIVAPTLVIAGGEDRSLPPAQSMEIHEGIRESRLEILPGVGHSAPVEDPGSVTGLLRGFWAMVPESA